MTKTVKSNKIKLTKQDRAFEIFSAIVLTILALIVAYPLYFVLIASFSDPKLVASGQVTLFPKNIMWDGYEKLFSYDQVWIGYRNTIIYTVIGTILNASLTMLTAYPLSRKKFIGKKFFLFFFMFTMYFSGGLVPTFLMYQNLGLYDNWMVLIIAGLISVPNVIICRTFMLNTIPNELYEAAYVDGISHWQNFLRIVVPLSTPVIIVMVLFYGVWHWNDYWTAMIYVNDTDLHPLQLVLRGILTLNQMDPSLIVDFEDAARQQNMAELMKYGLIVISSLPLIVIYPFFQKFFAKGVMIGSVKG